MKALTIILFFILVLFRNVNVVSQQVTWSRIFGETGNVSEQGVDMLQTFDGNYVVLASRSYDGNNQKILLLKLDAYGNVIWEKMVADSILNHNPYRFQQTPDSGFIITGTSGSAFLIKTDMHGNNEWRKVYADTYPQTYCWTVINDADEGYIFCGKVPFYSPPSSKGYIVKTDRFGNVIWEKVYSDSLFTDYYDIIRSSDGNSYYLTGQTYSVSQPLSFYTVIKKIDLSGETIWTKICGKNSSGMNIINNDENSLIINAVKQNSFSPRIMKIDSEGNSIWDYSYVSPSLTGSLPFICKDLQNNIQQIGGLNGNITYTEISPSGEQLTIRPFQSSGILASYGNTIKNCYDNGFMIVGTVFTGTQSDQKVDIVVIKTDSSVNAPAIVKVVNTNTSVVTEYNLSQNFPNPFNSQTTIRFRIPENGFVKIKVYDLIGREISLIVNEELERGEYSVNFNADGLSSGTYFYKLSTDNYSQTRKFVLMK